MTYWEDRLVLAGNHGKAVKALEKFRRSKKRRDDELKLYDTLEGLGVSGEEAEEIINLELSS
jgi:hypothetical protein